MAKLFAIAAALMCLCGLAIGQTPKTTDQPSRYIWYETAQINTGKYELFNQLMAQYRDATTAAAPDLYWITGSPITGDGARATLVTFHDSMASVEKMMTAFGKVEQAIHLKNANFEAQAAEAQAGSRYVLAEFSKELSYRPDMIPMANTAWWSSTLMNLKPGCEYEFADVVKQVIDVHTKAGGNDHWTAYNIRAGYPEPSILMVTTLRSLADIDEELPATAKELFGSAPMRQMFQKIGKECIAHFETTYFRVTPNLSRPPQSLIAANPDFWTIKEQAPAVAAKQGKAKKGPVKPAALTEKEKP